MGGVTIPVAPGSVSRDRDDLTDRRRSFDGTYRASQTGGAVRTWRFRTPPVTRALADSYEATLGTVAAQLCSGDLLGLPTMCCAQIDSGWNAIKASTSHLVELPFTLHEVQPAKALLKYAPGDAITGESFTRSTVARYFDSAVLLQTAAIDTKRDGHYIGGNRTLLLEDARANAPIWNRDLTNAAWVKTNCTAVKDQPGIDGASNAASKLTATGANATCLQSITLASSIRYQAAYVKRLTGVGDIQMTMDGGATWTQIFPSTGGYLRLVIPTQTIANPQLGFKIFTSGDVFAFDFMQNEDGAFPSSPIATTTALLARGADLYSMPLAVTPQEMTAYLLFVEGGTAQVAGGRLFQVSIAAGTAPHFLVYAPGGMYRAYHDNGSAAVFSTAAAAPVIGDVVEIMARLYGDGSVDITQSINSAPAVTAAQSAANALAGAWSAQILWLNSGGTAAGTKGYTAIRSLKVVAGARSLAEMRAL